MTVDGVGGRPPRPRAGRPRRRRGRPRRAWRPRRPPSGRGSCRRGPQGGDGREDLRRRRGCAGRSRRGQQGPAGARVDDAGGDRGAQGGVGEQRADRAGQDGRVRDGGVAPRVGRTGVGDAGGRCAPGAVGRGLAVGAGVVVRGRARHRRRPDPRTRRRGPRRRRRRPGRSGPCARRSPVVLRLARSSRAAHSASRTGSFQSPCLRDTSAVRRPGVLRRPRTTP